MKRKVSVFLLLVILSMTAAGCGQTKSRQEENPESGQKSEDAGKSISKITLSEEVIQLEDGLSAVRYDGDDGFDQFLAQGGAATDMEVISFLSRNLISGEDRFSFGNMSFGCSTIAVKDENGIPLFGRNFDWNACNAMIVQSRPENGYASISTVNTDFINMSGMKWSSLPDQMQAVICLYAPLDGMNEKGLAVSVNMIQDSETISQNTSKPDITTTTAIRMLLNKAATVEEAIALLGQYDMHASMGYMMHLVLADRNGRSAVIEYIDDEMTVTETPVVTNFYLAQGEKNGIGTAQSHERYDRLIKALNDKETMDMEDVRDALDSVSKKNFGEFESTEWSIVFNQNTGEVHYYHREHYSERYTFAIR